MLKIFIGPNGYGKTYELERIKKSLFEEKNDRKDVIAPQKTREYKKLVKINADWMNLKIILIHLCLI